jgi:eukaryotic-like serine/threonine-protein kinase
MTLGPGVLVNQNVRLTRLLGHGGMGAVWIADHLTLQVQVAVKFILADYTKDAEALERFSREASSAARIRSPHVVQVFDHGVFAGLPYIVMELLDGEDLASRIERAPLTLGEMAPILHQIGKALAHAHALGVVHRDIKPANVFLTTAGDDLLVKLLDFGVAKITRNDDPAYRKTQTGQLVGTPCFMSPEQIFGGGAVDYRVDLWALAVLVYEALMGALPFVGKTVGDVYLAINSATFAAPSSVDPVFPAELDAWFNRAFSRDPAGRFGSARELGDTFLAIAARAPSVRRMVAPGTLIEASSVLTTEPRGARHGTFGGIVTTGTRRRRRSKIVFASGILAGAAGMGALTLALFGRASAPDLPAGVTAGALPPGPSAAPPVTAPIVTVSAAVPAAEVAPTTEASAAPVPSASARRPLIGKPAATDRPGPPKRHDHGF